MPKARKGREMWQRGYQESLGEVCARLEREAVVQSYLTNTDAKKWWARAARACKARRVNSMVDAIEQAVRYETLHIASGSAGRKYRHQIGR